MPGFGGDKPNRRKAVRLCSPVVVVVVLVRVECSTKELS